MVKKIKGKKKIWKYTLKLPVLLMQTVTTKAHASLSSSYQQNTLGLSFRCSLEGSSIKYVIICNRSPALHYQNKTMCSAIYQQTMLGLPEPQGAHGYSKSHSHPQELNITCLNQDLSLQKEFQKSTLKFNEILNGLPSWKIRPCICIFT